VLFGHIDAYRFLFYISTLVSGYKNGQYNKNERLAGSAKERKPERRSKEKKKRKKKIETENQISITEISNQ
jgi:hypothetical protein